MATTFENLAAIGSFFNVVDDARRQELLSLGSALSSMVTNAGVLRTAYDDLSGLSAHELRFVAWRDLLFGDKGVKTAGVERVVEIVQNVWKAGDALYSAGRLVLRLLGGSSRGRSEAVAVARMQQQLQVSLQLQSFQIDARLGELLAVTTAGFSSVQNTLLSQAQQIEDLRRATAHAAQLLDSMSHDLRAGLEALSRQQLNDVVGREGSSATVSEMRASQNLLRNYLLDTTVDVNHAGPADISADPRRAFSGDVSQHANALAQWPTSLGLAPLSNTRLAGDEVAFVTQRYLLPLLFNHSNEAALRATKDDFAELLRLVRETRIEPLLEARRQGARDTRLPGLLGSRVKAAIAEVDAAAQTSAQQVLLTAGANSANAAGIDPFGSPTQPTVRVPAALETATLPACAGTSGPALQAPVAWLQTLVPPGSSLVLADLLVAGRRLAACYALPSGTAGSWQNLDWARVKDGVYSYHGDLVVELRLVSGDTLVQSWTSTSRACFAFGGGKSAGDVQAAAAGTPAWQVLQRAFTGVYVGPVWCDRYPAVGPLRDGLLTNSAHSVDWSAPAMATTRTALDTAVAAELRRIGRQVNSRLLADAAAGGRLGQALETLDALLVALQGYVEMSPTLAQHASVAAALKGDPASRVPGSSEILSAWSTALNTDGRSPTFADRSTALVDGVVEVWRANAARLKDGTQVDTDGELAALAMQMRLLEAWVRAL